MFESGEYAVASALKEYFEGEKMNKQFTGVIERLFVNDRKTAKGDKKSISIANNKIYYGLGLHDTDTYQVGGVTLKEGMEVSFNYEDGKYKNVVLDTMKIIKQETPKAVGNRVEKENMGMLRCHAFNGATSLLLSEKEVIDKNSILEAAKIIHTVTVEVKEWFGNTEVGKAMDQRELGNTVGNAVINCSNFSTRNSLSSNVREFLMETVLEMTKYISGKLEKQTATNADYDSQKLELHVGTQKISSFVPENEITHVADTDNLHFDDIPF